VAGILKKRQHTPVAPLVSALPLEIAEAYLSCWVNAAEPKRAAAIAGLTPLCIRWGIRRCDLRAIGAHLAMRAARPRNLSSARVTLLGALRHELPKVAAVDHYTCVNDPAYALAADIAELPREAREALAALVASIKKPKPKTTPSTG